MIKINITVLIGIPGAGKTYFSSKFKEKLESTKNYQCDLVSYDNLIGENYNHKKYKQWRKKVYQYVEDKIIKLLQSVEQHDTLILIDDNMYYRSMRYEYYKLAKEYNLSFLQVYLNTTLPVALARNESRQIQYRIPEDVITTMAHKLEIPQNESWELNTATLDFDGEFNKDLFNLVFDYIIKSPIVTKPFRQETEHLEPSKLQSVDLTLRKIVHAKLSIDKTNKNCLKRKNEIFTNIKNGSISIPDTEDLYNCLLSLF